MSTDRDNKAISSFFSPCLRIVTYEVKGWNVLLYEDSLVVVASLDQTAALLTLLLRDDFLNNYDNI